jgi:hypothetical protein
VPCLSPCGRPSREHDSGKPQWKAKRQSDKEDGGKDADKEGAGNRSPGPSVPEGCPQRFAAGASVLGLVIVFSGISR